jgi:hypothetical protein
MSALLLQENTLYSSSTERSLIASNEEVASHVLVYNFFGMLGVYNELQGAYKYNVLRYIKNTSYPRLSNISDNQNNMSLSVRLAFEARLFRQPIVPYEMFELLAELRFGNTETIDSNLVRDWANTLYDHKLLQIKDIRTRLNFFRFKNNEEYDLGWLAYKLDRIVQGNRNLPYTQTFRKYSKFLIHKTPNLF